MEKMTEHFLNPKVNPHLEKTFVETFGRRGISNWGDMVVSCFANHWAGVEIDEKTMAGLHGWKLLPYLEVSFCSNGFRHDFF